MSEFEKKFRIDPSINLGVVIQSLALIGTVLWFLVGKASTADQAQIDIKAFRAEVTIQFLDVKQQIAGIPDQRAAAIQFERRINEASAKNLEQDARLTAVEQLAYRNQTDIANMSHPSLPRAGARQ